MSRGATSERIPAHRDGLVTGDFLSLLQRGLDPARDDPRGLKGRPVVIRPGAAHHPVVDCLATLAESATKSVTRSRDEPVQRHRDIYDNICHDLPTLGFAQVRIPRAHSFSDGRKRVPRRGEIVRKAYLGDKDRHRFRHRMMHRGRSGYPHASSSAGTGTRAGSQAAGFPPPYAPVPSSET